MFAVPGGLIGVGTKIDPTLCRADRMVGQVLGSVGGLPDIFTELEVSYYLVGDLLLFEYFLRKILEMLKLALLYCHSFLFMFLFPILLFGNISTVDRC